MRKRTAAAASRIPACGCGWYRAGATSSAACSSATLTRQTPCFVFEWRTRMPLQMPYNAFASAQHATQGQTGTQLRGGAARTWEQRRAKAPAHIFWEPLRCFFQSSPLKEHTGACGRAICNLLTQSLIETCGRGLPLHLQVRRTRPQHAALSLRPAISLSNRYLGGLGLRLGLGLIGLWRLCGCEREACRCDTGGGRNGVRACAAVSTHRAYELHCTATRARRPRCAAARRYRLQTRPNSGFSSREGPRLRPRGTDGQTHPAQRCARGIGTAL